MYHATGNQGVTHGRSRHTAMKPTYSQMLRVSRRWWKIVELLGLLITLRCATMYGCICSRSCDNDAEWSQITGEVWSIYFTEHDWDDEPNQIHDIDIHTLRQLPCYRIDWPLHLSSQNPDVATLDNCIADHGRPTPHLTDTWRNFTIICCLHFHKRSLTVKCFT